MFSLTGVLLIQCDSVSPILYLLSMLKHNHIKIHVQPYPNILYMGYFVEQTVKDKKANADVE